jgi:hypothetical protein
MSKIIHKNEVFEIIQTSEEDVELYYKGEFLSTASVREYGKVFDEIPVHPEELLDFDASLLPPGFEYTFTHTAKGFFDWYGAATLSVEKKTVQIEYLFYAQNEELLSTSDINLFKLLLSVLEMAKKAGYPVHIYENDILQDMSAKIKVHVPLRGNLYKHYKHHLDIFTSYFQKAAADIVQNVLDGTRPTRLN